MVSLYKLGWALLVIGCVSLFAQVIAGETRYLITGIILAAALVLIYLGSRKRAKKRR